MYSLPFVLGRRMWIVNDFHVWGNSADSELLYLGLEQLGTDNRMLFGHTAINNSIQDVLYADLIDWRGNTLPPTINFPRIIAAPNSRYNAFLIGEGSDTGFRIARDPGAPGTVSVDLFIWEVGGLP